MKWGRPTKLARGYATVWRVEYRQSEDDEWTPYENRWYNKRGVARSLASNIRNSNGHGFSGVGRSSEIAVVGYAMVAVESETCFGKETT